MVVAVAACRPLRALHMYCWGHDCTHDPSTQGALLAIFLAQQTLMNCTAHRYTAGKMGTQLLHVRRENPIANHVCQPASCKRRCFSGLKSMTLCHSSMFPMAVSGEGGAGGRPVRTTVHRVAKTGSRGVNLDHLGG